MPIWLELLLFLVMHYYRPTGWFQIICLRFLYCRCCAWAVRALNMFNFGNFSIEFLYCNRYSLHHSILKKKYAAWFASSRKDKYIFLILLWRPNAFSEVFFSFGIAYQEYIISFIFNLDDIGLPAVPVVMVVYCYLESGIRILTNSVLKKHSVSIWHGQFHLHVPEFIFSLQDNHE